MRQLLTLFCLLHSLFLCAQKQQKHIVYFESAEYNISPPEAITLDSILNLLDPSMAYIVEVTGHTDSIGGVKYNQVLSKKRANAIQEYINQSDILFDISVMWKAHFKPAQSNLTTEGLARNRRVEISFTEVIPQKDIWDMPVQEFKLSASKAYRLQTKNGCRLTIRPGSFKVNKDDTVYVLVTEYNDPSDFLAGSLPMSFNKGREEFMYQSEQMMKIEAIVNDQAVELVQMIGLECPDVEVSDGLRLYKFQGKKEPFIEVRQKRIPGILEEIQEEELYEPVFNEVKKPNPKPKEEPSEKTTNSSKKEPIKESTKGTVKKAKKGSSSSSKSKKKRSKSKKGKTKKRKVKKGKTKKTRGKRIRSKKEQGTPMVDEFNLEPDTGKSFVLEPDTSRVFLLEPDTTRSFLLEPDTAHTSSSIAGLNLNNCFSFLGNQNRIICQLDSFKKLVDFGLNLKGEPIPIDIETDLNSYFARYKSSKYHGMTLKCKADPNQLNNVEISIKKRFLCRRVVLKFENTPNHPEYLPLKGTKWIVRYRKSFKDVQKIKDIKVNDFRIFRFRKADYSKKSKEGYYIELKGKNEMFRFPARPRRKKKSAIAFKKFRNSYLARVKAFDDEIRQFLKDKNVVRHFQLYELFRSLSKTRKHPCSSSYQLAPCLDFNIMSITSEERNQKVFSDSSYCLPLRKPYCDDQHFMDWVKFYNLNRKYVQKQIEVLKNDLPRYYNCVCGVDTLLIDTITKVDPCYKWEYADLNSRGNKITYIGLGIYNLDYVFRLNAKQVIKNPVFITNRGDTLRTCLGTNFAKMKQTNCGYQVFSIIPNFNGLLEHNFLPRISLLLDKENILFITTPYKRYKCYVDMREQDKFVGNTFILQDITEKSKTLEGLREELTKTD